MISYAAAVWGDETSSKQIGTLMTQVDRKALLAIAVVKPLTPTEGFRVIYNVEPLGLHLKRNARPSKRY